MRRSIRKEAWSAVALLVWLGGVAARGDDRGRIVEVRMGPGDDAVAVVQIEGDRPLDFTTLKLSSPERLVLDFPDVDVQPGEVRVDDGTVVRVGTRQAGARTARVVIELTGPAEFDVRAEGARLDVRVPRRTPRVASESQRRDDDLLRPGGKEPGPPAAAPGGASAADRPDASAASEEDGTDADERVAAGERPAPPPEVPGAAGAPPDAGVGEAAAEPSDAGLSQGAGAPASSGADAAPATGKDEDAGGAEADARKRASLPTVSIVAERPAAAAEERPALRTDAGPAGAGTPPLKTREGPRPTPEADTTPPPAPPTRARRALTALTGIGFRPADGGEVRVRSAGALSFEVKQEGDVVVLRLPGATIPLANNRRPLDTRFFGGNVQRIEPRAIPGGIELRIELRKPSRPRVQQSGGLLTATFPPG